MNARLSTIALATLLSTAAGESRSDTTKLTNRQAFGNVTVTDFRDGRVIFRGVSGQYLRKPLAEVEWLSLSGQTALNAAEQAASRGDWTAAVPDYENARQIADQPWLRNLIAARLLAACDRAGLFDRAMAVYAELLAADPAAARPPRNPGPVGSDVNRRAARSLEDALRGSPKAPTTAALRALLLEVLLYEDAPVDLETLGISPASPEAGSDSESPPASQPASAPAEQEPLGILPPLESQPTSRPTVPPPRLPADSFLLDAAGAALDAGDVARAARLVERGLPYVQDADKGPWRLLLGRCRTAQGRTDEAISDLRELADGGGEPRLAARALYYLGVAYERRNEPRVAAALYDELLQRPEVPEDVAEQARQALRRVRP